MKQKLVAFASGVVFALGLGISGMTDPSKVLGFLDVTGAWDPSLAFVMAGALAVYFPFARWAKKAARPLWGDRFSLPELTRVDGRLLVGSALFGLGWGTAGYCPGPAVVAVIGLSTGALTFCAAMLAGIVAFRLLVPARKPLASPS